MYHDFLKLKELDEFDILKFSERGYSTMNREHDCYVTGYVWCSKCHPYYVLPMYDLRPVFSIEDARHHIQKHIFQNLITNAFVDKENVWTLLDKYIIISISKLI
jgi:hypothetical protein